MTVMKMGTTLVRELYDITTEEAIVESLRDVNVELETDYEWNESEEDYE